MAVAAGTEQSVGPHVRRPGQYHTPPAAPEASANGEATGGAGKRTANAHVRQPGQFWTPAKQAPTQGGQTEERSQAFATPAEGRQPGVHTPAAPNGEHPEYTFADALDVVNPLQHIPGVASAYQEITGDKMKAAAEVAGGMLYGGPIGFAGAVGNTVIEAGTGDDIGGHVTAAVTGESGGDASDTAVAESDTQAATEDGTQTAQTSGETAASTASAGTITRTNSTSEVVATRTAEAGSGGGDVASTDQTGSAAGGAQPATGDAALARLAGDLRAGGETVGEAPRSGGKQASADRDDGSMRQTSANAQTTATRGTDAGGEGAGQTQTAAANASAAPDAGWYGISSDDRQATQPNDGTVARRLRAEEAEAAVQHDGAEPSVVDTTGSGAADTSDGTASGDAGQGNNLPERAQNGEVPGNFAERMQNALKKYRAMQTQQQ